jgi:hypothetical protein
MIWLLGTKDSHRITEGKRTITGTTQEGQAVSGEQKEGLKTVATREVYFLLEQKLAARDLPWSSAVSGGSSCGGMKPAVESTRRWVIVSRCPGIEGTDDQATFPNAMLAQSLTLWPLKLALDRCEEAVEV